MGLSSSTFTVDKSRQIGIFDGVTKIVPKLKAPGFCNMQTASRKPLPDISSANALELVVRSTVAYTGFKAAFGPAPRSGFFAEYKADFPAMKTSQDWQTVHIPFDSFSSKWSSYTGEPTTKCSEDKSVCPDKEHLRHLDSFEIAAEGVAGKFHLEAKSIKAVSRASLTQAPATKDIVDLAASVKDLSTLVTALKAGNLTGALSGKGPFTVFAPTNEAFAKLPKSTLAHLLDPKNIKELQAVLEYHVIAGAAVHAANLKEYQKEKTLEGEDVFIVKRRGSVFVDFSRVTTADVGATNGVVHIIDRVLIPHIKPPAPAPAPPATKNIVDLAVSDKDLSTLVTALKAGNLTGALSGKGPFTVFAPTNEAFAKLPKSTLAHLLDPKNIKELQAVLEYHVIAGAAVHAADLKEYQKVKTLEGDPVYIIKHDGAVYVDHSRVTAADVGATNGVVHIIDRVLVPLH